MKTRQGDATRAPAPGAAAASKSEPPPIDSVVSDECLREITLRPEATDHKPPTRRGRKSLTLNTLFAHVLIEDQAEGFENAGSVSIGLAVACVLLVSRARAGSRSWCGVQATEHVVTDPKRGRSRRRCWPELYLAAETTSSLLALPPPSPYVVGGEHPDVRWLRTWCPRMAHADVRGTSTSDVFKSARSLCGLRLIDEQRD